MTEIFIAVVALSEILLEIGLVVLQGLIKTTAPAN